MTSDITVETSKPEMIARKSGIQKASPSASGVSLTIAVAVVARVRR
jgi:hypothetical protein